MAKRSNSIGQIRKKITTTYETIFTAHHESCHCIYALLHLMVVKEVSIFEDKQLKRINGLTAFDATYDLQSITDPVLFNTLVRGELGVFYAGLIGERLLYHSISGSAQTPTWLSYGSSNDNLMARQIIKQHNLAPSGKKRTAYKQKLMREVRNELIKHWEEVSLLAHTLFKSHKLIFEDLQTLLTTKGNNRKFWKEQFRKLSLCNKQDKPLDEKTLVIMLN